jgi:hypothetical protein
VEDAEREERAKAEGKKSAKENKAEINKRKKEL